jgi:hypothetical protein
MRYAESRKYWVVPGTNYLKYKEITRSMSKIDLAAAEEFVMLYMYESGDDEE